LLSLLNAKEQHQRGQPFGNIDLSQAAIFKFMQQKCRVEIWLYDNTETRLEGKIVGFDEYMNIVLDDTTEV
jgi:small nuclear ribonucleoprotein (snRNP)-like protein